MAEDSPQPDGYYGDDNMSGDEIDLSFLDEDEPSDEPSDENQK